MALIHARTRGGIRVFSGITLFLPRVGVVVVSTSLPIARFVAFAELDSGEPLRALPKIRIGDERANGRAMGPRNGTVFVLVCDEHVRTKRFVERNVRGVAVRCFEDYVARVFSDAGARGEIRNAHAGPVAVEERPLGHAVHVARLMNLRHREELREIDLEWTVDSAVNAKLERARARLAFLSAHRSQTRDERLVRRKTRTPIRQFYFARFTRRLIVAHDVRRTEHGEDRARAENAQERATIIHRMDYESWSRLVSRTMDKGKAIREKLRDPGFTAGRRDVAGLFELLAEPDEDDATKVIRALAVVPAGTERAIREWSSAAPPLRHRLVALVARARGDDALDVLISALENDDPRTRKAAARGLGRLQNATIREAASRALRDVLARESKPEVKRAIVEALGKIGSAADVLAIANVGDVDEASERVRREAVTRITRTEGRAAPAHISDRMLDAPIEVELECREGLETILASELPDARVVRAGHVATSIRSLRELTVARTWTTAALVVHQSASPRGSRDDADLVTTIADAAPLLRSLTDGPIRWRVEWVGEGHKRAATRELAGRVAELAPELVNDPIASDWEIRVSRERGKLEVLAVPKSWDDARFSYRVADVPAASHPTIAAAIARVADVREDDVAWDPFVGSALELIERARLGPYRALIGTDLDEKALKSASKNVQSARVRDVHLELADARTFTPKENVTLVLTNPPMGRRVQLGKLDDLFATTIENVARVLTRGGRFVWITPRARVTNRILEGTGFRREKDLVVDMRGFAANLQRWTW